MASHFLLWASAFYFCRVALSTRYYTLFHREIRYNCIVLRVRVRVSSSQIVRSHGACSYQAIRGPCQNKLAQVRVILSKSIGLILDNASILLFKKVVLGCNNMIVFTWRKSIWWRWLQPWLLEIASSFVLVLFDIPDHERHHDPQ